MEKESVGLLELETAVLECFLEKTPLSPLGVKNHHKVMPYDCKSVLILRIIVVGWTNNKNSQYWGNFILIPQSPTCHFWGFLLISGSKSKLQFLAIQEELSNTIYCLQIEKYN
jgi:hypothetical protein